MLWFDEQFVKTLVVCVIVGVVFRVVIWTVTKFWRERVNQPHEQRFYADHTIISEVPDGKHEASSRSEETIYVDELQS